MISFGLDINRQLTKSFIDFAPVELVLTPVLVTQTSGGRNEVEQSAREPQTFTLLEPGDSGDRDKSTQVQGTQLTIDFLLIGAHDSEMADGDRFTYQGRKYKLVHVLPENGYERRARVIRHGW